MNETPPRPKELPPQEPRELPDLATPYRRGVDSSGLTYEAMEEETDVPAGTLRRWYSKGFKPPKCLERYVRVMFRIGYDVRLTVRRRPRPPLFDPRPWE